ncbi:CaiB/BaiF CoA transferase family protein [Stella sp.]|uniref:CaiB/BaiF CoA transferase family protein n=1 Tax=Stella sp. TaxID=2912054 RepID=UPI0035AE6AA6
MDGTRIETRPLPLAGLRVVEVGIALAGPFAGSLLADMGAEVVKVERRDGGDPMRLLGRKKNGVQVWWGVAARNKRVVTLNLKAPEGKALFEQLIADADVVVENYRPGVMDRLGIGWAALSKINPRLVMLSVSGFGQTGPDSGRPGFGKIAEALSGMVTLTGEPDETPQHVGFSLADTSAGLMGFFAISAALYARDCAGGTGTHIDLALYEPLFRMADCQLALRHLSGRSPAREASNDPYGWGAGDGGDTWLPSFACADGRWVMLLVRAETRLRLAALAGLPADSTRRELAAALVHWFRERPPESARAELAALGVEVALVHDGATLAEDPYFGERGDVLATEDPVVGPLIVPGYTPRGYDRGALRDFRDAQVGENNAEILGGRLGVDGSRLADMERTGVV